MAQSELSWQWAMIFVYLWLWLNFSVLIWVLAEWLRELFDDWRHPERERRKRRQREHRS
jgi:hypothetical protein